MDGRLVPAYLPHSTEPRSQWDERVALRNLFIVTHPEATHHVENLVGGWYDSSLTARGMLDAICVAKALGVRLAGGNRTALFCSDLLRARQTAQAIAEELAVEIRIDADLRERSYGAADGTPTGSTPYLPPPLSGDRMRHHDGVAGSETRLEWAGRAYAALERMLAEEAGDVVVVTHGGTASYLIAAWIKLPLADAGYAKFRVSPGSITHLREDDLCRDRQVVTLNDIGHLA